MGHLALVLGVLLALAAPGGAQRSRALPVPVPPSGPGLGNLTYAPGELFQPASIVASPGGHGNVAMVQGYLLVIYSSDGGGTSGDGGIEYWDVSDPRDPRLARRIDDARTHALREPHGFAFTRADGPNGGREYMAAQGVEGILFWDVTTPLHPTLAHDLDLPDISPGDYSGDWWVFWQAPWVYVAGTGSGLYVVDASDPRHPSLAARVLPGELAGLSPSLAYAVGNLLVLTESKSGQYVTLDVSDPTNPTLLSTFAGKSGYSHLFAAGKILTSGGEGDPTQMHVHDVAHDGTIAFVGSAGGGLGNGGYGSYQDGLFHSGFSTKYGKFDVAGLTQLGSGSAGLSGSDEDFGQVLGNLVWVGNDHGQGSALLVHDVRPDSLGPDVHWVHPPDGAAGVATTSRVGLSLSDSVDLASVHGATFAVREPGGAALPGRYSVQMGLVNYCPDTPFAPNTLYEVEVAGLRDLVGNSGGVFTSRFTTGAGAGGPLVTQVAAQSGLPYATGELQVGSPVYVDRVYTYSSVPPYLAGQPSVLTANDDKGSTEAGTFLSFELAAEADVYVLYDFRATALPAWLAGWTQLPETVGTSDVDHTVHLQRLPAGTVQLGGNLAPPAAGAGSMYTVVAVPTQAPPTAQVAATTPVAAGAAATLEATALGGTPPLTFSWDFGDGTPPTAPSPDPCTTHVYQDPGRYSVLLTVENGAGAVVAVGPQVVHEPLPPLVPTGSGPIVADGGSVFVAHPDNDTVAALDATLLTKTWEVPVGRAPRSLALAPDGTVWVVTQDDATVDVLDRTDGALLERIALPRASRPYGIAFAPDGSAAFVSLQAPARAGRQGAPAALELPGHLQGGLVRLNPARWVESVTGLPGKARGVAVTPDGASVLVTRFVSPSNRGEVWEVDPETLAVRDTFALAFDAGPDTESSGRGVPNYVSALRVHPGGSWALVPSKKDNVARGLFRDGLPLTFESRTRTVVSRLDLVLGAEDTSARRDLDDRDMAQAVAFSPLGDVYVVATQGTNTLEFFDAASGARLSSLTTGRAPQGVAFTADGTRLFVHAFLDRAVLAYDTSALVSGASNAASFLATVPTVQAEVLAPEVLAGKRVFYGAADRRMNLDGYISCASCHLDGGADGRVWDFTQAGEGLRETIPLVGRAGTAHGNVHWTANFDEIQDFENDVRGGFAGSGFLVDTDFEATQDPLGAPKAGLSAELDALAGFVASLDAFPPSPFRASDGGLTRDARRGRALFHATGCATCHPPPAYTDLLRHDVGTLQPGSGLGSGQPLPGVGLDTPTLRAVWSSPPYFHDGQAPTLEAVLAHPVHGGAAGLSPLERRRLLAYLRQIE